LCGQSFRQAGKQAVRHPDNYSGGVAGGEGLAGWQAGSLAGGWAGERAVGRHTVGVTGMQICRQRGSQGGRMSDTQRKCCIDSDILIGRSADRQRDNGQEGKQCEWHTFRDI
jgi:hypothetical protein